MSPFSRTFPGDFIGGRQLISNPVSKISRTAIQLDDLDRYRRTKVHFVDCVIAATAGENLAIASFDQDLRRFNDVRQETE
jgi:predicted nucleic acid-binding protein